MSAGTLRGTRRSHQASLQIRFPWGLGAAPLDKGECASRHLGGTLQRVTVQLRRPSAPKSGFARADARRVFVRLAGCFRVGSPLSPRATTSDRVPFRGRFWLVYSFGGWYSFSHFRNANSCGSGLVPLSTYAITSPEGNTSIASTMN